MSDKKTSEKTAETTRNEGSLIPPVNVIEDAGGITLYADLPGVPKDKMHLHAEGDTLTIDGEIQLKMPEGMESTHAEVGMPRFHRAFTLSKELDVEKIVAGFDKGVLKIRIPKATHAQPRKIEIRVE